MLLTRVITAAVLLAVLTLSIYIGPFAFASVPNCTMSLLDYPNFFLLSHQGEVTQTKTFTPAIVSVNRYESVDCLFGFYVIGKV